MRGDAGRYREMVLAVDEEGILGLGVGFGLGCGLGVGVRVALPHP